MAIPCHGRHHSLDLTLPPLGAVFLKAEGSKQPLMDPGPTRKT